MVLDSVGRPVNKRENNPCLSGATILWNYLRLKEQSKGCPRWLEISVDKPLTLSCFLFASWRCRNWTGPQITWVSSRDPRCLGFKLMSPVYHFLCFVQCNSSRTSCYLFFNKWHLNLFLQNTVQWSPLWSLPRFAYLPPGLLVSMASLQHPQTALQGQMGGKMVSL